MTRNTYLALLTSTHLHAQQDYWYCIRQVAIDIERAYSAQSLAELNNSLSDIASDSAYAFASIQVTTSPLPEGLGLNESAVLNAPATAALNQYTDFQLVVAKDYNWVVALAATIPCVQVGLAWHSWHKCVVLTLVDCAVLLLYRPGARQYVVLHG